MLRRSDLAGVRIKTERAKKHIADLVTMVDPVAGFIDGQSSPHRVYVEIDPQTREQVVRFAVMGKLDPMLGAVAGDAVHNLRSALDLLWWQLVVAGGGTPTSSTEFPISVSKDKFEAALKSRRVKGTARNVRDLLESLKPYQGGNGTLWAIHRVDIVDKHHVLIPAAAVIEGLMVPDGVARDAAGRLFVPNLLPKNIFPVEDKAELFRLPPSSNSEVDVHPEAVIDIAFGDPEVVVGESMIPTLTQLADYVESVVRAFAILP